MIIRPQRRSVFLQQLVDHNPFYLISAACMLWGCLSLTNSLSWTSIPIARLLTLIATLNIYEGAIIALSVFLIVHRKLRRDGVMLLILEAFFLVDVSFLNAEIVTANLRLGIAINAVLFVLAMVKLWMVVKALGASLPLDRLLFIAVELAALFALPIVFRWMDHGSLSPRNVYAAWWVVGMLPLVRELLAFIFPRKSVLGAHDGSAMVYVALPWISLVAHLAIFHYVYDVTFFGANAAPLLLGLAIVLHRLRPTGLASRRDLLVIRILLPAAALMVSVNNPAALSFGLDKFGHLWVTTSKLALVAVYLTYVYCFLLRYAMYFIPAGVVALVTAAYGPSPAQMSSTASTGWGSFTNVLWKITPKTTSDWGIVAVAAAFAFLALGAAVSLRRTEPMPAEVLPLGNGDGDGDERG